MISKNTICIKVYMQKYDYEVLNKIVKMHNEKNIRYIDFFNKNKISISKIFVKSAREYIKKISFDKDNFYLCKK